SRGIAQGEAELQTVLEMSAPGRAFGCGGRQDITAQECPAIGDARSKAHRAQNAVGGRVAAPFQAGRGLPVLMRGVLHSARKRQGVIRGSVQRADALHRGVGNQSLSDVPVVAQAQRRLRLAAKWSVSGDSLLSSSANTQLVGGRATWDIGRKWDFGVAAS